jgi:hypothetical protein
LPLLVAEARLRNQRAARRGADAYFKALVQTKPGYVRFWNEMETAFDEPFRAYVTAEFRRRPQAAAASRGGG